MAIAWRRWWIALAVASGGCLGWPTGRTTVTYEPIQPFPSLSPKVVDCATVTQASTVTILDMAFHTPAIGVDPEGVVRWNNADSVTHSVVSGTSDAPDAGTRFDSGDLEPGRSFCVQFHDSGIEPYHCGIHPDEVQGEVVVRGGEPDTGG